MNIPSRFQIFDAKVDLPDKDQERLAPYLASWIKLSEVLFDSLNESDVMRLTIMELMGNRRKQIVEKLLGRAGSLARKRIVAKAVSVANLDGGPI